MIKIITAQPNSDNYKHFVQMILKEWGQVDQLPTSDTPNLLPMPLLALDGPNFTGGLSFIAFKHPSKECDALWINSVYVDAKQRGKGIASQLIRQAESVLLEDDVTELFVYSNKPSLYTKLGWEIVSVENNDYVLRKSKQ